MNFVIGPDESGLRLDVYLSRAIPGRTRSQIQALNRSGGIRVNGDREKSGYRLRGRDRVDLDAFPDPDDAPQAENIPLHVYYEDEHLAVVEKPAGMVVHPGAGNRRSTLVHALLGRFPDLSDAGGRQRPGIVHRLDKLTSGLVVVARTNAAYLELTETFRRRQVEKSYLAAVHGQLGNDGGEIALSIRRHPRVRTRMAADSRSGRSAHSEYRVLERCPHFSSLDVRIRTGRTHQIRVHLSAIGHPVVGDPVYGARFHSAFVRRYGDPGRYFLHAARLRFPHPQTGAPLSFESPLPADLVGLWERLKSGS